MNKKSKVTNVQASGTWEGKFGLMYKFEVEFENGDAGEYSSKSKDQNKFLCGVETEYEYIDGKFPKVKPVWVQNQQQINTGSNNQSTKLDNREELIVKQSSLKAAVEFCNKDCTVEHIIANAEVFYDWVMTGKKPEASKNDMPF